MRIVRGLAWATTVAVLLVAGPVRAGSDGLVLRATGWYQGVASVSADKITCQVPTVTSAYPDNNFVIGLGATFGIETTTFPDVQNPFGDPCGGWVQVWNSMRTQGINLTRIVTKYKIAQGNKRFGRTGLVPMQRSFPLACRQLRRQKLFLGARLEPNDPSAPPSSSSGRPNSLFVQVIPQYSADLISCIRAQFGPLATDVFTSLPLVAKSKIYGRADSGQGYRSNTIRYTLTLMHTCGNGVIDNFEDCDPTVTAPGGGVAVQCTSSALCVNSTCFANPTRPCASDTDCIGTCGDQGTPSECSCFY
jgi:hypothetical protein